MQRQPIPLPDQISGFRSGVINQIRDFLISLTPIDTPFVRWVRRPDGMFPVLNVAPSAAAAADSAWTFGYTVSSSSQVTLTNGILVWGDTRFTLADTAVTITDDGTDYYIGIEFDGSTITVPAPSSDITYFTPDDTTYRTWFYGFKRESGGSPVLQRINQRGMVEIDSAWGPGA